MNLTRDEALALSMHFHRLEASGIELSPMMEDLWKRITVFLES
jgi:hypothetical protein